jgi:hypothetical protein
MDQTFPEENLPVNEPRDADHLIESLACDECKNKSDKQPDSCEECKKLHIAYAESMGKPSPIMAINITNTYYASGSSMLKLPMYKTWGDVESWLVIDGVLYLKLKGEEKEREYNLSEDIDVEDSKYPVSSTIYTEDYAEELDHHE